MKKTYIAPTLWVEKIQLSQFVCLSGTLSNSEITDANNVGAKGGGLLWSDDEPEDYE